MIGRALTAPKTRTAFTLVDQGLSSFSNFALGIVVARNMSVLDYGVFASVYSIFGISVGISRAFATDPLVVRFSGAPDAVQHREGSRAIGSVLAISAVFGLVLIGVSRLVSSGSGVFVAMAVGLPFLLVQDSYRYFLFTTRRSHQAAMLDTVWVGAFLLALGLPAIRNASTPETLILAWAASALLSLVLGIIITSVVPDPRHMWSWLKRHRDLGPRFAGEFWLSAAGPHVVIYITAIAAGYAAAGAVRGGNVLLGPVWIAAAGLVAAAVPEGVRLKDLSLARFERIIYALAVVLAFLSLAWGLIAANLPDSVGSALLGATWPDAQPLMFTLGVFGAGNVAAAGLVSGLRSLAAARRSFAAMLPMGILVILGGSIGAYVDGARGACLGMVAPAWIGAGLAVRQFRLALRDVRASECAAMGRDLRTEPAQVDGDGRDLSDGPGATEAPDGTDPLEARHRPI